MEDDYELDLADAFATAKKYRKHFDNEDHMIYFIIGYLVNKGHNFHLAEAEALTNIDLLWNSKSS